MPLNYDLATGKWVDTYKGSIARSDVMHPCAICGWGPHMAIHGVPEGTEPAGVFGLHSWVPEPSKPRPNRLTPTPAAGTATSKGGE